MAKSKDDKSEFEEAGRQRRVSIISEFLYFLRTSKKWWLLPILIIFVLIGLFVLIAGTPVGLWIYPFL